MMFSQYSNCEPTELGRKQFYDHETHGRKPENPDPFYERLQDGKGWFNVQQSEIRGKYLTDDWWGWYTYWIDWKGKRWVLKHLFSWCQNVPDWLFREDIDDEDIM